MDDDDDVKDEGAIITFLILFYLDLILLSYSQIIVDKLLGPLLGVG